MERKTKIVATLGPATQSRDAVRALIAAGMDVARLNFSHGDHQIHRQAALWVREEADRAGRPVALLQDVQGPKIRVGRLGPEGIELEDGERLRIVSGSRAEPGSIPIDYPMLLEDLEIGHGILLADGQIRLVVEEKGSDHLVARVLTGGLLEDRKGAAFPDTELRTATLTTKDEEDLAFGRELDPDYVAVSFVQSAEDLRRTRELVDDSTKLIAKIELAAAYRRLDAILEEADGVMVARGDLGVQLPLQKIPGIQHDILRQANQRGRIAITATEMLESMTHSYRPTRAEVMDVASAVFGGTDAVMLSAETAIGRYAARSIEVMGVVCAEAETTDTDLDRDPVDFLHYANPFPSATARAAVQSASALGIETIVAFTESGDTPRLLSMYRPQARVVAFTPVEKTRRQMALLRGVRPLLMERADSTDRMIAMAEELLLRDGSVEPGEGVVFVAGVPPGQRASTNLMKLHRIGELPTDL